MNSANNDPLAFKNILAGIIVTVVGGVILAFFLQDARFAPKPATRDIAPSKQVPTATSRPTSTLGPTVTPLSVPTSTPTRDRSGSDTLEQTSFYLPGDGVLNNNGYIGPFCCTGETATVRRSDGSPIGYIYFFGWEGQAYQVGDRAIAPSIEILVSGAASLSDIHSEQQESKVAFLAEEMTPGASRSSEAGSLFFTVTIEKAELTTHDGRTYFFMGEVAVRVDVSVHAP